MQDARLQVTRHSMLQRALDELDPVTFFSDRNKKEQNKRIGEIENLVGAMAKKRRGRLQQSDMLEIDHRILSYKKWQAGAQQNLKRFEQDEALFRSKPGYYKLAPFLAATHEFHRNGYYPKQGGLQIAPGDYLGPLSKLKPPGFKKFKTITADKIYKNGGWEDTEKITTQWGVPMIDNPDIIDPVATRKAKETHARTFLHTDPQRMAWANDGYTAILAAAKRGDPSSKEIVAKYEHEAAEYAVEAEAIRHEAMTAGEEVNIPPKINPAYMWGVDQGTGVIMPGEVSYSSDFEEVLPKEEDKEEDSGRLELVIEGAESKVFGQTSGFTTDDKSTGTEGVSYHPTRIDRMPKMPKDQNFLIDGSSFIVSVPRGGKFYDEDNGSFAYDVSALLNHSAKITEGFIDYDVPIYSGAGKISVESDDKTYHFRPGQPVSTEQRPLLEQYAKDNEKKLNDILQESGNDFARFNLELGSSQGVRGNVTVYRNLNDGHVQNELPLFEKWGYQPKSRPKVEEEIPEAIPEAATPPEAKKGLWGRARDWQRDLFKREQVVEDDWDKYKR